MDNIVDEAVFVTDFAEIMENIDAVAAARAEAFGGIPAVSQTMVQVAGLVHPELKLEIKRVAQL